MKNLLRGVIPVALVLVVAHAHAGKVQEEKLTVGGTFLTSRIDANSDGGAASWCTMQIKGGDQGSSTMQCVNEDVFAGSTAECPGGLFVESLQGQVLPFALAILVGVRRKTRIQTFHP